MFHPDARIKHGEQVIGELREEDWRLYTGEVVHPSYIDRLTTLHAIGAHQPLSERSQILGRASVIVHHPGDLDGHDAVWEGSFTVGGELYNVVTRENYERVKTWEDVNVQGMGRMVIFRQSDMRHDQGTNKTIPSCSHDSLAFNDLSNPVFNTFSTHDTSSYSFLNPLGMFWKRDDTGGMTGSSNYISTINDTSGCPDTQKIVYMGVALDCNYVALTVPPTPPEPKCSTTGTKFQHSINQPSKSPSVSSSSKYKTSPAPLRPYQGKNGTWGAMRTLPSIPDWAISARGEEPRGTMEPVFGI